MKLSPRFALWELLSHHQSSCTQGGQTVGSTCIHTSCKIPDRGLTVGSRGWAWGRVHSRQGRWLSFPFPDWGWLWITGRAIQETPRDRGISQSGSRVL